MSSYGKSILLEGVDLDTADQRTREALKAEGFGVLTEIDVKATLKTKLDVDVPGYKILGACNPPFAHKALTAEPAIGLLLPCNVVVREVEGGTEVSMIDPHAMFQVVDNDAVQPIADEVGERLDRALAAIKG